MDTILFIGGTGRSGTTVTKTVFGQHPEVFAHDFEYRWLIDPGGILDFYHRYPAMWTPYRSDQMLKGLYDFLYQFGHEGTPRYTDWYMNRHCNGWTERVRYLIEYLTDYQYEGTYWGDPTPEGPVWVGRRMTEQELRVALEHWVRDVFHEMAGDATVFCCDDTWNVSHGTLLARLLPEAKFLWMERSREQTIRSLQDSRWAPSEKNLAKSFHDEMMEMHRQESRKLGSRCIHVDLHDLTEHTEAILGDLCSWLGLEMDDRMLDVPLHYQEPA